MNFQAEFHHSLINSPINHYIGLMLSSKFLPLLVLTVWTTVASAQLPFYYPDGRPYKRQAVNMNDINKDFDNCGRVKIETPFCSQEPGADCLTSVGYKLFTDTPLWVLTNSPEKIPEAVKAFNVREYLLSWEFESDLETFIKKKCLTDAFILKTLGAPDDRSKYFSQSIEFENWYYEPLGLKLTLTKGIVTSYTKI
jgi:hypothetical protein